MPCHRATLVALGILLSLIPSAIAQPIPVNDLHGDPLPDGAIGRLGTTRLRHAAFVRAATFLPDGKTLASADDDGTVCLWDVATGKERTRFRIGPGPGAATTFSPDGRLVACSNGHEFRLYDLATGKLLHEHGATPKNYVPEYPEQAHSRPLLGFSGDSRTMAAASADRAKVHVWEVSTGKELRTLDVTNLLDFTLSDFTLSPDGKLLATAGFGGKSPGAVWDISTGKRLVGFPFFSPPVFAPDGKTLAAVSAKGRQIVLCEAATGKQLHAFGFLGAFHCLAFAPDGKTLAALDGKGRQAHVRIWDVTTHAAVSTFKADDAPDQGVARLVFSRDGRRLACVSETRGTGFSDTAVQLWELPANKNGSEPLRLVFRSGPATPFAFLLWTAPVQCALADDGATLAVTMGNSVRLWDTATGKERHGHPGPLTHVTELALSADGRQVATSGPDGVIHLWDAGTRKVRIEWLDDGHMWPLLAFAADGKTLTCCKLFGTSAVRRELPAAREVRRLQTAPPGSDIRALSPDGRTAAWVTQGLIALLDVATGKEQRRLDTAWDPRQQTWNRAVFSPDSKRFAIVKIAATGPTILQWDLVTGRKLPTVAGLEPNVGVIAYSADGRIVAVARNGKVYSPDGRIIGNDPDDIRLCEAATGKEFQRIEQLEGSMRSLAFAPDGRRLAVGFADGGIRVWDLATGKMLDRLDGHRGTVWSLQFSPDGKTLYSASADTTVLIWDVSRRPLAALPAADLAAAWTDLAGDDATKAYRAVWSLAGAPKQAVPFLSSRLKPIVLDEKQVRRWIADLDSDDFETRETALRHLTQQGPLIEPLLKDALAGKAPLETRRRLEQMLKTMQGISLPLEPRLLRAVQALELIGNSEARAVLESLAKGAAAARQTREARESLERLDRRNGQLNVEPQINRD